MMVSDTVQDAAQVAHDVGLAAWLGGAMFGKFAHNPSLRLISSAAERGQVANAAWNGYNLVNALGLGSASVAYVAARLTELQRSNLSGREEALVTGMDALMGVAVSSGIANFALGLALARQAPEGAVPVETGTVPAPQTPPRAARIQRAIGVLGTVNIASGVLLVAENALFRRGAFSRPAARRALTRSSSSNGPSSLVVGAVAGALAGAGNEVRRRVAA
jgi:hypothetical protein